MDKQTLKSIYPVEGSTAMKPVVTHTCTVMALPTSSVKPRRFYDEIIDDLRFGTAAGIPVGHLSLSDKVFAALIASVAIVACVFAAVSPVL